MDAEEQARRDAALRAGLSDTSVGICTGIDWASQTASVNIGGSPQTMFWAGPAPWIGDPVRVIYAGRNPICFGQYGSAQGTVVSVAGNIVSATGDDGEKYVYPAAETFSSGQRIWLNHAARLITARYLAEPAGSKFVLPPPPPVAAGGSAEFRATGSGNYRGGTYQGPYVEISDSRSGFYAWGRQIEQTIPDPAVITKMVLRLTERWDNVTGTPSRLGTHTAESLGGSPPGLSGVFNVSGGGEIDLIQAGYANALKTGAALGVGFYAGYGYRQFDTAAVTSIYAEWA